MEQCIIQVKARWEERGLEEDLARRTLSGDIEEWTSLSLSDASQAAQNKDRWKRNIVVIAVGQRTTST